LLLNFDNVTSNNPTIHVAGAVSLNGATLGAVYNSNFMPTVGQQFTLIDNDGTDAVSGTFAGKPEGSTVTFGTTRFLISYVGNGPSGNNNDVVLTRINPEPFIASRLFYKGSTAWDVTNNNLPGFSDDNAIAPDKTAYLPGGGAATFAAISSYTRGINGIMIDTNYIHGTITANDFIFKIGNNNSPSLWATATGPTLVTTRAGAGVNGTDRVELLWSDNAVQQKWLEVVLKGNDTLGGSDTNTGLAFSHVFYYGSALADSGAGDGGAFVTNSIDEQSARNDPHSNANKAAITNVNDFNRDRLVNATDQQFTRAPNANSNATAPKFINIGPGGPFAPVSEPGSVAPLTSIPPAADASALSSDPGDPGIASALACQAQPTNLQASVAASYTLAAKPADPTAATDKHVDAVAQSEAKANAADDKYFNDPRAIDEDLSGPTA
jgi:hypothetical protein